MVTIDLLGDDEDLMVGVTGEPLGAPASPQEPRRAPRDLQVVVVPQNPERAPKNPFLPHLR